MTGKTKKTAPKPRAGLEHGEREALGRLLAALGSAAEPGEEARREAREKAGRSPAFALAAVEELATVPSRQAAELAVEIGSLSDDKALRKEVKKTLFRLKQRGVAVDDLELPDRQERLFRPVEREEPYGLVTPIDGSGERLAFLVIPLFPRGRVVGGGVVGEPPSLRRMMLAEMTRSELDGFLAQLGKDSPFSLMRTSFGHVASLFQEAARSMEARGGQTPQEYLELKPWIGKFGPLPEKPVVYEVLDREEVAARPELKGGFRSLLARSPFNLWFIPRQELDPYLEKLKTAAGGLIILSPAQQARRREDIIRRAAGELYPPERRGLMRRRLEESAYLLYLAGDRREAETALAAALDLEREPTVLTENEFLLGLVEQSAALYQSRESQGAEEPGPSGLILPPGRRE